MGVSVCPAAIVAAPVERVWDLLMDPASYERWWDIHGIRVAPPGPAQAGHRRSLAGAGPWAGSGQ